jgi:hypothetical protein
VGFSMMLLGAAAASAKDICVTDTLAGTFVFQKPKALKKPGQGTSLSGYYSFAGMTIQPLVGTAVVGQDGAVRAAITVYNAFGGESFSQTWTTDATLAGLAQRDTDNNGNFDATPTLTAIDCKTFPTP